jgi:Ser/Thr protein kinase RdoA (MazF antagonist)
MRRPARVPFDILPGFLVIMSAMAATQTTGAVRAAAAVAARLGLDASAAVALRDVGSTVVHLRPSPVVARVWPARNSEEANVRREVEVARFLADHGGAVAAPYVEAGPYAEPGHVLTLWEHVDHDDERPLDGHAAGRALRHLHDLLVGARLEGLPHFARLAEVGSIVDTLDLPTAEKADLEEMRARAATAVGRLDVPLQPVHGDAWLGNVLRTPDGPLWSDLEKVCLGPRELDLACNEYAASHRGRTPADDAFLAGYGTYDADVLQQVAALELVPLTAWTYRLAARQPEYLPVARARLDEALAGLTLQG